MNRKAAIDYITSHVAEASAEPCFVFLGRDALAVGVLDHYRRTLQDHVRYAEREHSPLTRAALINKAAGLDQHIAAFEDWRPQRLPGTEGAPRA